MHFVLKKNQGFTLIEFLLYIGISVTMLAVLGNMGFTMLTSKAKAHAVEELHYNAEYIIEKIVFAVEHAENITTPSPGATSSVLTLTMSDPAKNPTVFDLVAGSVRMQEGVGEPRMVSGQSVVVSTLQFTNMTQPRGAGTLRLELAIEAYNPGTLSAYSAYSTYYTTANIKQSP